MKEEVASFEEGLVGLEISGVPPMASLTFRGLVSSGVLIEARRRLRMHPDYREGLWSLLDFRLVTGPSMSTAEMIRIRDDMAANDPLPPGVRCAVVVSRDMSYGIARMFSQWGVAASIEVFRDMGAARAWLRSEAALEEGG